MNREFTATAESQESAFQQVEENFVAPDLTDSYFFDHPLDHLPGTYLVSKTFCVAVRRTELAIANFWRCHFAWHEFAELDQDVNCLGQSAKSSFEGCLFQKRKLATFGIDWTADEPQPIDGGQYPAQTDKPDPVFAHKNFASNVLVSNCQRSDDETLQCYVFPPEAGHPLEWKDKLVHPLFLLESCKQFLTVAGQTMFAGFSNQGPNSKFQLILKSFSLELFRPIAATSVPHLQLDDFNLKKWRRNVPKAADFTVSIHVGSEIAGQLSLESLVVEPDFFRYLRSQSK